jgi:hypothetical protein
MCKLHGFNVSFVDGISNDKFGGLTFVSHMASLIVVDTRQIGL